MERIKQYFKEWDFARYFKLGIAVLLALAYLFGRETFYLAGSIFFFVQALLNVGCGCSQGTCRTKSKEKITKTAYEIEQYKPESKI